MSPTDVPQSWVVLNRSIAQIVASLQLTPISTGGSKYQAMTFGPNQLENDAPKNAPVRQPIKYFIFLKYLERLELSAKFDFKFFTENVHSD